MFSMCNTCIVILHVPPFSDGAEIDKGSDFRYAILIDINVVELKQRG